MFERFTDRARRVLVLAQEEARLLNHNFIGTEHILLGLIHEEEGIAARALRQLDVSLRPVRDKVSETIGAQGSHPTGGPPFTPRAKKVLELSLRESMQLGHSYIGTEHLLLGIVREGEGVAAQVLVAMGAGLDRVRQQVLQLLDHQHDEDPHSGAMSVSRGSTAGSGVTTLADVIDLGRQDGFLAVVSTLRSDGTIQSSVVNAGSLAHPVSGAEVVGFVTYGKAKLSNLRRRPQLSVTFRAGWKWATVEGQAELFGPSDTDSGLDDEELRLLLREVFKAAGGSHDDWDAYDRTMTEQGRTAVLVSPTRLYSN